MEKMYMWEIEYQVSGSFTTQRSVKVVTATDSYGEAERLALDFIDEQLKDSGFEFNFIASISPSRLVHAETPIKAVEREETISLDDTNTLGEAIKKARKQRGLSLHELGRRSGVSHPYLSQIETTSRNPSGKVLKAICEPLGVDFMELFEKAQSDKLKRLEVQE